MELQGSNIFTQDKSKTNATSSDNTRLQLANSAAEIRLAENLKTASASNHFGDTLHISSDTKKETAPQGFKEKVAKKMDSAKQYVDNLLTNIPVSIIKADAATSDRSIRG